MATRLSQPTVLMSILFLNLLTGALQYYSTGLRVSGLQSASPRHPPTSIEIGGLERESISPLGSQIISRADPLSVGSSPCSVFIDPPAPETTNPGTLSGGTYYDILIDTGTTKVNGAITVHTIVVKNAGGLNMTNLASVTIDQTSRPGPAGIKLENTANLTMHGSTLSSMNGPNVCIFLTASSTANITSSTLSSGSAFLLMDHSNATIQRGTTLGTLVVAGHSKAIIDSVKMNPPNAISRAIIIQDNALAFLRGSTAGVSMNIPGGQNQVNATIGLSPGFNSTWHLNYTVFPTVKWFLYVDRSIVTAWNIVLHNGAALTVRSSLNGLATIEAYESSHVSLISGANVTNVSLSNSTLEVNEQFGSIAFLAAVSATGSALILKENSPYQGTIYQLSGFANLTVTNSTLTYNSLTFDPSSCPVASNGARQLPCLTLIAVHSKITPQIITAYDGVNMTLSFSNLTQLVANGGFTSLLNPGTTLSLLEGYHYGFVQTRGVSIERAIAQGFSNLFLYNPPLVGRVNTVGAGHVTISHAGSVVSLIKSDGGGATVIKSNVSVIITSTPPNSPDMVDIEKSNVVFLLVGGETAATMFNSTLSTVLGDLYSGTMKLTNSTVSDLQFSVNDPNANSNPSTLTLDGYVLIGKLDVSDFTLILKSGLSGFRWNITKDNVGSAVTINSGILRRIFDLQYVCGYSGCSNVYQLQPTISDHQYDYPSSSAHFTDYGGKVSIQMDFTKTGELTKDFTLVTLVGNSKSPIVTNVKTLSFTESQPIPIELITVTLIPVFPAILIIALSSVPLLVRLKFGKATRSHFR